MLPQPASDQSTTYKPFRLAIFWPAVLLFLFVIALALAAAWAFSLNEQEERAFRYYGKTTQARVTYMVDKGRKTNYYADYVFTANDPRSGKPTTYRGYGKMVDENYVRARDGMPVFVVYAAAAPQDNRPRDYEWSDDVVSALMCLAFALFLAVYLCRHLVRYWGFRKPGTHDQWVSPFWSDPDAPPEEYRPFGY